MRVFSTGFLALFFLAVLCGNTVSQEVPKAQGEPDLVFEKKEHNFGEVQPKQIVKHIFRFKNEGDALLLIDKVKATCGCTGTLLSAEEIAPGAEGKIEVTFKAGPTSGRKKKAIHVYSNDPDTPDELLHIIANVVVPLEVKPKQIHWIAESKEYSTRSVEFNHLPELDVNITGLETSNPAFKVSSTPRNQDDRPGYDIEVSFDGSLPSGNFMEQLTIKTDHPDYPVMKVFLRGRVEGKIRVVPNAVALGVVKEEDMPTRTIRIYAKDNRPFQVSEVETTSPLIKTELVRDEASGGYRVNVSLTEKPPQGAFSEKIYLTNSLEPDTPTEVTVYAFVQ